MTDDTLDETRVRELGALIDRLPREIDPPSEAWDAIRAQMARDESGFSPSRGARETAAWQRPPVLIAASLVLVVGSSALTFVALRERSVAPATVATSTGPAGQAAVSTVSSLSRFTDRETDYLRRVNGLVTIMESGEPELAPETIAKVKESLAVIDAAILEARDALASDPANRQLIEMLDSTYEKKLDLLQRTTAMARS